MIFGKLTELFSYRYYLEHLIIPKRNSKLIDSVQLAAPVNTILLSSSIALPFTDILHKCNDTICGLWA